MMTTEQVQIFLNNLFGGKWKIEIGLMENRKQTRAFFFTNCVTGSIIILTNFQKILTHFERLTCLLPDTTNLILIL
jgi:hypothetical protein